MTVKRNILLAASLVLLISFSFASPAMAAFDFGQAVLNAILTAVGFILGLVFNIIGTITGAFLGIAVLIFNWVSSPNFISLSYTNAGLLPGDPRYNQFVGVGWELTRSLANIIFVIAMVAIGIGTALRIRGYQMQQTLVWLIVIALLVNFTPVIAGLIIDGANIVMGFFVNPNGSTAGQIIAQKATSQWANIKQLTGGGNWDPSQSLGAAAASFVQIFFNLIAAIIYLLFAGIFVLRYIALWLLVIISPFAFACYILPKTRSYFTQWWKMFTQWAIVGIIAGFFLYLSEHLLSNFQGASFSQMQDTSLAPGFSGIANALLPSIMPIILLFIGFVASIAGAPAAAQGILKAGERGLKTAGKTFGKIYANKAWEGVKKTPGKIKGAGASVGRGITSIPPIRAGSEAWKIHRGLGHGVKESLGAATERAGAAIKLETGWRTKEAVKSVSGAVKAAPGEIAGAVKAAPGKAWAATKSEISSGVNALRGKGAAKEGIGKAFGDSIRAGWGAATGMKKRKKGEKCINPACQKVQLADTDFCPFCGFKQ